jgi:hypothetical protein
MNPIPPEQDNVRALATDDEERSRDGFGSHGQGLAIEVSQRNIGLDQVLGKCPNRCNIEYSIILTAAPVSTNILFTG